MSLALATSIPFSVWVAEPDEVIATAMELLDEMEARRNGG